MEHSNQTTREISKETAETFKKIVSEVQDAFYITDIFRRSNSPIYTIPRSVVFHILINRKGLKSIDICELAGIKNNSRSTYYLSLFSKEIRRNKKFCETVRKLGYE